MIRDKKGSTIITTPLVIVLGLIIVSVLIVLCVNIITPFIWYEKLSSTCIKYLFVMEEYGYLTVKEKYNLIDELGKQGFDVSLINVDATDKRQNYGDRIYIDVEYLYNLDLPVVGKSDIFIGGYAAFINHLIVFLYYNCISLFA